MRDKVLLLTLAATAMLIAGETPKTPGDHRTFPLPSGGKISIEAANGSVEISGWDRESVEISGLAGGDSELQAIAGDTTLSIHGLSAGDSDRVQVRVPRRVTLDGVASSNGSIHVSDVEGDVHLTSSNGRIEAANVRGLLNAHSSNGAIVVRGQDGASKLNSSNGPIEISALSAAPIEAYTSNGPIVVRMPASLNANLNAKTSNGSIRSDFEVKPEVVNPMHTHLEGTIGSGGPLLKLTSSNGAIHLLKGSGKEKVTSIFTPGPVQ